MSKADTPQQPLDVESVNNESVLRRMTGTVGTDVECEAIRWALRTIDNLQSTLDGLSEPETIEDVCRAEYFPEMDGCPTWDDFVARDPECAEWRRKRVVSYLKSALAAAQQQAGSPKKKSEE